MAKRLYMVSLGPGDPELITIKALKALQSSDAICIPTKSADNSFDKSLTHSIVSKLMALYDFDKPLIPVYTPMKFRQEDWQRQVDLISSSFDHYERLSFVTLGDSAVYSTVYYILDIIKLQDQNLYRDTEVIAGVTSFSQASAKIKKPLCVGDSRFTIVPLIDRDIPTTTIYMRPKIGMSTDIIKESGDIYTFENLNYKGEEITPYKKSKVDKYMTLFIDFFKERGHGV